MKCKFVATGLVRHLYGNLQLRGLCSGCHQDFQSFSSYRQEAYTRSQTSIQFQAAFRERSWEEQKPSTRLSVDHGGWDPHKRLFFGAKILKCKAGGLLRVGTKPLHFHPADGLTTEVWVFLFKTVISRKVNLSKHTRTLVLMLQVEARCCAPHADSSVLSRLPLPSRASRAPLHYFYVTVTCDSPAGGCPGPREVAAWVTGVLLSRFWLCLLFPRLARSLQESFKTDLKNVQNALSIKWIKGGIFCSFSNLPIDRFLHVIKGCIFSTIYLFVVASSYLLVLLRAPFY